MAKAFETWTVLPHKPIQKLTENLWAVQGTMPSGPVRRWMTVARLRDGRLVIHNAVALDDGEMAELEAFGTPSFLLVPNGYHRQDAKIYKQRYPNITVLCPKAAKKGVAAVVAPDGTYDDFPVDGDVTVKHFEGVKQREGYVVVRSQAGASLIVNDMIANIPKTTGIAALFMQPTGRPSVPRVSRWFFVSDREAVRADFERLASLPDLKRLIVMHGAPIERDPPKVLREIAAEL